MTKNFHFSIFHFLFLGKIAYLDRAALEFVFYKTIYQLLAHVIDKEYQLANRHAYVYSHVSKRDLLMNTGSKSDVTSLHALVTTNN